MSENNFDAVIIGGGPGGYITAERLANAGKKVLLAEMESPGGTCLNVGCIPTKALLNSAKLYHHALDAKPFGVTAEKVSFDWEVMQKWKAQTVSTLVGGVTQMLKKAGVDLRREHATLLGPGRVRVGDQEVTAKDIVIATGSVPVMPPIPGADSDRVVDSTGLLSLETVPDRLVVIGGGVIGIEFASLFAALGSQVDVIEATAQILPFMDTDLAGVMQKGMPGVKFHLNSMVTSIDGDKVNYKDPDGKEQTIAADTILMAVGRRPALTGWGAEEAGLAVGRTGIKVDETMRTNLPGVWAVGDVTGESLLAHAAYRMGEIAAAHIVDPVQAGKTGQILRKNCIPWAVYSIPEAAGVGLTESAAKQQGLEIVSQTVPLVLSGRFVAENGLRGTGVVKLIAEKDSGTILGIHMIGPYSPETIWGAALVLEEELSVDDLRQVIFPHPTVSEGIREAAWAIKI